MFFNFESQMLNLAIFVKAWFVTFKILLFNSKNEQQLLQSASAYI